MNWFHKLAALPIDWLKKAELHLSQVLEHIFSSGSNQPELTLFQGRRYRFLEARNGRLAFSFDVLWNEKLYKCKIELLPKMDNLDVIDFAIVYVYSSNPKTKQNIKYLSGGVEYKNVTPYALITKVKEVIINDRDSEDGPNDNSDMPEPSINPSLVGGLGEKSL